MEAIRACGLPQDLRLLDLSDSNLDSADLDWIVRHDELFVELTVLDLRNTLIKSAAAITFVPVVRFQRVGGTPYQFSVQME